VTCCFVTYFSYVLDGMNHSKLYNIFLDNKCTPGLHCLLMRSLQSSKVFNPLVSIHSKEMSMTLWLFIWYECLLFQAVLSMLNKVNLVIFVILHVHLVSMQFPSLKYWSGDLGCDLGTVGQDGMRHTCGTIAVGKRDRQEKDVKVCCVSPW